MNHLKNIVSNPEKPITVRLELDQLQKIDKYVKRVRKKYKYKEIDCNRSTFIRECIWLRLNQKLTHIESRVLQAHLLWEEFLQFKSKANLPIERISLIDKTMRMLLEIMVKDPDFRKLMNKWKEEFAKVEEFNVQLTKDIIEERIRYTEECEWNEDEKKKVLFMLKKLKYEVEKGKDSTMLSMVENILSNEEKIAKTVRDWEKSNMNIKYKKKK